jgi:hypothetical protein
VLVDNWEDMRGPATLTKGGRQSWNV